MGRMVCEFTQNSVWHRADVETDLIHRFRWVELQLEFLCTVRVRSILLKRLQRLPPGLEKIYIELYKRNITELDEAQAVVVKKILSWLLVAKVPLRTAEMCRLVCAPNEVDISTKTVLDLTFDMVRLDTELDQFRFSHLSVRESLEKRQDDFGQESLQVMATRACLASLSRDSTINSKDYAAVYWPTHSEDATKAGGGATIEQELDAFLQPQNDRFKEWNTQMLQACKQMQDWKMSSAQRRLSRVVVKSGSSLLLAACFALSTQVQKIISDTKQPVDIELKNHKGEDALCLASEYGSVESVRALLERGANVNAQGGEYGNALQAASAQGHKKVVQLLLEKGANVNAQGGRYGNALQAAAGRGHEKIAQLLLDRGAGRSDAISKIL